MTTYSGSWKVIKSMIFAVIAACFTYLMYLVVGTKMGFLTNECVEYVNVVDIVSVEGKKITIMTESGTLVLDNTSDIKQGKEGYCPEWKSIEEW